MLIFLAANFRRLGKFCRIAILLNRVPDHCKCNVGFVGLTWGDGGESNLIWKKNCNNDCRCCVAGKLRFPENP